MTTPIGTWPVTRPEYPVPSAAVLCEAVNDVLSYLNCDAFVEGGRAYLKRSGDRQLTKDAGQFWTNAIYASSLIAGSPEEDSELAEEKFSEMCRQIMAALEQKMLSLGVSETHKAIRVDDPEYGDTIISFVHRDDAQGGLDALGS